MFGLKQTVAGQLGKGASTTIHHTLAEPGEGGVHHHEYSSAGIGFKFFSNVLQYYYNEKMTVVRKNVVTNRGA